MELPLISEINKKSVEYMYQRDIRLIKLFSTDWQQEKQCLRYYGIAQTRLNMIFCPVQNILPQAQI